MVKVQGERSTLCHPAGSSANPWRSAWCVGCGVLRPAAAARRHSARQAWCSWALQCACQGLGCLLLQGERRMLDDPSETEAPHSLDQWTIRPLGAWLWPVALVQA